jgi:hypothetical protein
MSPGPLGTDYCIYCRQPKQAHFPTCPTYTTAVKPKYRCKRCFDRGGWFEPMTIDGTTGEFQWIDCFCQRWGDYQH